MEIFVLKPLVVGKNGKFRIERVTYIAHIVYFYDTFFSFKMHKFSAEDLRRKAEVFCCDGSWEERGIINISYLPVNVRLPNDKGTVTVRNMRKDEMAMFYDLLVVCAEKDEGYVTTELLSMPLFADIIMADSYCVVFELKESKELLGLVQTVVRQWPTQLCDTAVVIPAEKVILGMVDSLPGWIRCWWEIQGSIICGWTCFQITLILIPRVLHWTVNMPAKCPCRRSLLVVHQLIVSIF